MRLPKDPKGTPARKEDASMPRKGIPYGGFSGKRQEAGDRQRRQDALAEQAAREEGVVLDPTLCLRDKGISAFRGRNWKRGDVGKFLDRVEGGVIPAGRSSSSSRSTALSRDEQPRSPELPKRGDRGIASPIHFQEQDQSPAQAYAPIRLAEPSARCVMCRE
jgi:hypothetical protein